MTYFGDFVGVFRIQTYYCYGRSLKFVGPFSYFSDQSSNIQKRAKISSLGWMPSDFENILEISLKSPNANISHLENPPEHYNWVFHKELLMLVLMELD